MKIFTNLTGWQPVTAVLVVAVFFGLPYMAGATSQWSRQTGMSCSSCHSVFPRLNSFGEEFLRNGYQMPGGSGMKEEGNYGGVFLEKLEHLLGFRLNMTPIMYETNSFRKDSGAEKQGRLTLGNPVWIQFFVAGSIYKDISFFSELEYAYGGAFKFNWFYFNFTNILEQSAINFQVGNISPLEFASYPDRLPQLSNIKGEVFHIKPSNGKGENSTKIRDAHGGIQYYGRYEWALWYTGISPGLSPVSKNQFPEYWGGIVAKLPENIIEGFEGSTLTLHYQSSTDTKNTGEEASSYTWIRLTDTTGIWKKEGTQKSQTTNQWTRFVPSVNIRFQEKVDVQFAYLFAEDKNWGLVASPTKSFKYSGIALEAGYMPNEDWHFGLHYDNYSSKDENPATGKPIEYQRIVPVLTYIINQNIRFSTYYEKDLTDKPSDQKVDKMYLNIRMMF